MKLSITTKLSPVVRYASIRYLLAVKQQPKIFDDVTCKVCFLKKSKYGLKQSGRVWNETINNELIKIGLTRGEVGQYIYYKVNNSEMVYAAIYVCMLMAF